MVILAISITGSMAYAMSPTAELQKPAVAVNKTEPAPTQKVAPVKPKPVKKVTWKDNPKKCNEKTQYIAKEAPFKCIAKPAATSASPVATLSKPAFAGSHQDMLAAAGIAKSDWAAADYIIMHEGHYDPCVRFGGAVDCAYAANGGQLAYGACQSLPGSKMASAGKDWASNVITQLRWCDSYAKSRHGGWWGAYNYWLANSNW